MAKHSPPILLANQRLRKRSVKGLSAGQAFEQDSAGQAFEQDSAGQAFEQDSAG